MKNEKLEWMVARLKEGDARAFDCVYEHTHKSAYFAILYIVHDKMYAEDILQETFVKAISSLAQYTAGTNFTAWLCSIARSLALNHLKKHRREVPTDFEEEAYKFGTGEAHIPYIFDLAARVLAEDEYEILMLCQISGYKRREVAEMLGIPIGTVTWKNNEALKKLRRQLEKEDGA